MLVCDSSEDNLVIFYGKKNLMELGIKQSFYRNSHVERTLIANNNLFIVHMEHLAKYCSRDIIFY